MICTPVFAQSAANRPAASLASVPPKSQTNGSQLVNTWVCASGMRLEVYPVSFDDPTAAPQYVVVYRQDGGVVASERIDARTAKQLPAYGCNDSDMRDRSELLG